MKVTWCRYRLTDYYILLLAFEKPLPNIKNAYLLIRNFIILEYVSKLVNEAHYCAEFYIRLFYYFLK